MTGGRAAGALPTTLIVDLVMNPADPGYAVAAARRGGRRAWYDRPLVVMGCLLVGFTVAVAYVHTNRGAPQAATVHRALVARVKAAQATRAALDRTASDLAAQIAEQRDAALAGAGGLSGELRRAQLLAGATAVTGPGVVVRLGDPPIASPTAEPGRGAAETGLLTDRDVRSVVNQLWSAGAEAISVNDVRLTPSSAIRFAGQAVLVDFQPITSPYTIRAIGNADGLVTSFADSEVASRYHTLAAARGLTFSFDEAGKLSLPASTPVTPRYARAATSTAPTSPVPTARPTR
jgi:uncharacterized protein YlxW (UPF0749 family)